jgi:hypothetical protein
LPPQVARDAFGVHDADRIAVLFVENGDDAGAGHVLERHFVGLDGRVGDDELVTRRSMAAVARR